MEVRRRQQQTMESPSEQRLEGKPRGPAANRSSGSFIFRNLPAILGIQVLLLGFMVLDPFKLRTDRAPPPATDEGPNKVLLGIADVEEVSRRSAINGTILVLVCPAGYEEFVENWFAITAHHTELGGRFLIFAEDEATFEKLNKTYPRNVVLRMDVKEPLPDAGSCSTQNTLELAALQAGYRKVVYTRELMNTGTSVFLCDVTAVWARNPYPHFTRNDVYLTLGDLPHKATSEQLLVDYPSNAIQRLQAPLPRGVGKLPPLSDEFLYLQNNVGAWVTLDYWAVVIEGMLIKECNASSSPSKAADTYTTGAANTAFMSAVHNTVHLSPRPHIGLLPPGRFPPPTVFFEDDSWRSLIEKDAVVVRTKLGAKSKEGMKARLQKIGLWRVADKEEGR